MADLAHYASGPASSEPAGIASQQASGPASSDRGKLRVFISYSREDLDFADQLAAALDSSVFECFIDREGISGGEAWKRRLGNLISEADTVIFVLSPSSARSETCNWEVEEAARLNKRILPANWRPLEGVSPPSRLGDLNYIFFYKEPKVPGSGFGTGLASLVAALNTDFEWLREQTRYLQRAMEWDKGGRAANRLLSGNDILEAKAWAARRPKGALEPTALHLEYIRASEEEAEARLTEQRKQLQAMAAAQAERETALQEREEALKQRARVARVRNIALVAVSILALLAVSSTGLSLWSYVDAARQKQIAEQQKQTAEQQKQTAEQQKQIAEKQTVQADYILARATIIISKLQDQMDIDTKTEAVAVFKAGAEHGSAASMSNLGLAYERGIGETQDYAKAQEWYGKAAANGDARGMNRLGQLYSDGLGVPRDYTKAREWFEKAAAKDNTNAMVSLGQLYSDGRGVTQDFAKARAWFEKAAAKDRAEAMVMLGFFYKNGYGVTQDYAKARGWYEKAAVKGSAKEAREWLEEAAAKDSASAKLALDRLPIDEAAATGRYAEALQLQEAFAAKVEAEETKRDGTPGEQTAGELTTVAWYAFFAKEFTKASTVADRSRVLFPDNLAIETNRVHALMFIGHVEEAKALYLAHKGEVLKSDNKLWEQVIVEDFAEFRKADLTHPMMADIEKALGVSPDGNADIGQR